jgi:hypothetical protein
MGHLGFRSNGEQVEWPEMVIEPLLIELAMPGSQDSTAKYAQHDGRNGGMSLSGQNRPNVAIVGHEGRQGIDS